MKVKFIRFGEVKVSGVKFTDDFLIAGGEVFLRDKTPSRKYKRKFSGHTPLSVKEAIPWNCEQLIVGTGAEGLLPIMKKVRRQAQKRGVKLVIVPTPKACKLVSKANLRKTNAIIHVTC